MIQVILILFNQKHNYFFQIVIIDIIISEKNIRDKFVLKYFKFLIVFVILYNIEIYIK